MKISITLWVEPDLHRDVSDFDFSHFYFRTGVPPFFFLGGGGGGGGTGHVGLHMTPEGSPLETEPEQHTSSSDVETRGLQRERERERKREREINGGSNK